MIPVVPVRIRWTRVNKTYTIYDIRLKITGLLEGSEYQFRVTAANAAGDSQPSDASPYILCKDPTCKTLSNHRSLPQDIQVILSHNMSGLLQILQLLHRFLASPTQPSTASA